MVIQRENHKKHINTLWEEHNIFFYIKAGGTAEIAQSV